MEKNTHYNKIYLATQNVSVRNVMTVLLAAIAVSIFLYVYLLASTTVNVTMRKTLQNDSRELQSKIADLEAEYMVTRSALTLEKAKEYGFIEPDKQVFVYRHKTSDNLALVLE